MYGGVQFYFKSMGGWERMGDEMEDVVEKICNIWKEDFLLCVIWKVGVDEDKL